MSRIRLDATGPVHLCRGGTWTPNTAIITDGDRGRIHILSAVTFRRTAYKDFGEPIGVGCAPVTGGAIHNLFVLTRAGDLVELNSSLVEVSRIAVDAVNPDVMADLTSDRLVITGSVPGEIRVIDTYPTAMLSKNLFLPLSEIAALDFLGGYLYVADGKGSIAICTWYNQFLRLVGVYKVANLVGIRNSFVYNGSVYYVTSDRCGNGAIFSLVFTGSAIVVQVPDRTKASLTLLAADESSAMSVEGTKEVDPEFPEILYWYPCSAVGILFGTTDIAIFAQQGPGDIWFKGGGVPPILPPQPNLVFANAPIDGSGSVVCTATGVDWAEWVFPSCGNSVRITTAGLVVPRGTCCGHGNGDILSVVSGSAPLNGSNIFTGVIVVSVTLAGMPQPDMTLTFN